MATTRKSTTRVEIRNARVGGSVHVHAEHSAVVTNVHADGDICVSVSTSESDHTSRGLDDVMGSLIEQLGSPLLSRKAQDLAMSEPRPLVRKEPGAVGRFLRRDLFRDSPNGPFAGVCAGLAAGFNINPFWLRLGFFGLAWFGLSGVGLYILAWLLLPDRPGASLPLTPPATDDSPEMIEARREVDELTKN